MPDKQAAVRKRLSTVVGDSLLRHTVVWKTTPIYIVKDMTIELHCLTVGVLINLGRHPLVNIKGEFYRYVDMNDLWVVIEIQA